MSTTDDYLVVIRKAGACHHTSRGTVVAGGSKLRPLGKRRAEALQRELLERPDFRSTNVWVIHRDDF